MRGEIPFAPFSRETPYTIKQEEKLLWHLHIYVVSTGEYAATFSEDIINYLKKTGFKTSKNKNDSVSNAINYLNTRGILDSIIKNELIQFEIEGYNEMGDNYKKILQQAGIRSHTFHALRHTFATRCIELGFDMKTLSEIMGHSNISITMQRYVHPSMEQKKAQMNKLSLHIPQ